MLIRRTRWKRIAGILALSSLISMLSIQAALAEGGINHKVKVKESCGKNWKITLKYGVGGNQSDTKTLNANDSVTFETKAKCPYSISGEDPYHVFAIYKICATGGFASGGCMVDCRSSNWKIVKTDSTTTTSEGAVMCKFVED